MKDAVLGILPALVAESANGVAVFYKAVSVNVSIRIDPIQSQFDVRPEIPYKRLVARSFKIVGSQKNEKGCRVRASIIEAKGNLIEPCHFTAPGFVEDLPRFRVLLGNYGT